MLLDGAPLELIFASPGQINAYTRPDRALAGASAAIEIQVADRSTRFAVAVAKRTPGVFVASVEPTHLTLWAAGLGAVEERAGLSWTVDPPTVRVNGVEAQVLYSGLAPGWLGLYQVNVLRTPAMVFPALTELDFGDGAATATAEE